MQEFIKAPKIYLDIINQIFEIEKKMAVVQESNSVHRNINRLKEIFETEFDKSPADGEPQGFIYYDPTGESYNDTRSDCEASIAGTEIENLQIIDTIKPIIRFKKGVHSAIVQKAIVIVQSKPTKI